MSTIRFPALPRRKQPGYLLPLEEWYRPEAEEYDIEAHKARKRNPDDFETET